MTDDLKKGSGFQKPLGPHFNRNGDSCRALHAGSGNGPSRGLQGARGFRREEEEEEEARRGQERAETNKPTKSLVFLARISPVTW